MFGFIIGVAIILGIWWWFQFWPFDGTTSLPKRDAAPPIPRATDIKTHHDHPTA